jgi:hypothetical protein
MKFHVTVLYHRLDAEGKTVRVEASNYFHGDYPEDALKEFRGWAKRSGLPFDRERKIVVEEIPANETDQVSCIREISEYSSRHGFVDLAAVNEY